MDLCFSVHKLEHFSSNPVKVHFEGLVHLLIYIRGKNNFGLDILCQNIEDAPLSDLLIQANIKTENQFMVLYDSI